MEIAILNIALAVLVFVGLYWLPSLAEKYITLGLAIMALVKGNPGSSKSTKR